MARRLNGSSFVLSMASFSSAWKMVFSMRAPWSGAGLATESTRSLMMLSRSSSICEADMLAACCALWRGADAYWGRDEREGPRRIGRRRSVEYILASITGTYKET